MTLEEQSSLWEAANRRRDAIRILFIIDAAGSKPKKGAPDDTVKELIAEKRLQALDFWVRNPDYLSWEILQLHKGGDKRDGNWPAIVKEIMQGHEPSVRRVAMLRFRFGAWEALDDALGTLVSYGLVYRKQRVSAEGKPKDTTYYLTEDGAQKVAVWSADSCLSWYAARAALVARVAGSRSGNELKMRQHAVQTYHDTKYNLHIPPIENDVRALMREMGIN